MLPEFKTTKERIEYLVANKAAIVELKKAAGNKTGAEVATPTMQKLSQVVGKAVSGAADTPDAIERTVVANTYYWMDSHDDVHIPGIFSKAIASKLPFHLHDHIRHMAAKVGTPKKAYEQAIAWRDLGVDKDGFTEALFVDTVIKRSMNASIFDAYKNGEADQHSVGMQYVRMALAVNDPQYKDEYKEWQKHIDKLGNPEQAELKGYFWAQYEAKLPEFSCVLEGSNILTPTLPPAPSTLPAPEKSTQGAPRKSMLAALGQQLQPKI